MCTSIYNSSCFTCTVYVLYNLLVTYVCQEFNTALHLAVELANLEMVQALLTIPDINLRILNKVGIVVYTYVHLIIHMYKFSRLGDLLHFIFYFCGCYTNM